MSLITRCPACGTAFRVRREQLAAHFGTVRCGKCDNVFNGVAALVEEGGERLSSDLSPQLRLFDPSRRPPQPTDGDEARLPNFMAPAEPPRARMGLGMATAVAAVLLRRKRHIAIARRSQRSCPRRARRSSPCQWLGCTLALPRRAEVLSIESSDLQADPRRQNVIVLHALIRNRSRLPQEYPALELTLTDEGGQPVLRRVLLPSDYVELERVRGIAAGGEAALRVYLDASGAPVTSYRLYLFYPA